MKPLIDDKVLEKRYTQKDFDRLDCPSTSSSDHEEDRLDTLPDLCNITSAGPLLSPVFNKDRKKLKISDLCNPESPPNRMSSHHSLTKSRFTKKSLQQPTQGKSRLAGSINEDLNGSKNSVLRLLFTCKACIL